MLEKALMESANGNNFWKSLPKGLGLQSEFVPPVPVVPDEEDSRVNIIAIDDSMDICEDGEPMDEGNSSDEEERERQLLHSSSFRTMSLRSNKKPK
jgi:hypothetical protein